MPSPRTRPGRARWRRRSVRGDERQSGVRRGQGRHERSVPMTDRVGDVGYGKTEVVARGAFKATQDGKQVAVLVPTRCSRQPPRDSASVSRRSRSRSTVSRFVSAKDQAPPWRARDGSVDVVIGTHRLLSKDVRFRTSVGRGRRGAAVRRGGQGAPQAAPPRSGRADAVRDADPTNAQPGDGRYPRPVGHRDATRRPAADPDARRRGVGRSRAGRDPARARPWRAGVLRPQPGRDDRSPGGAAPPAPARCPLRRRARPDGGGRAGR